MIPGPFSPSRPVFAVTWRTSNTPQVNQIFSDAGYLRITLEFVRCLPDVLRVIRRSRRLVAKWPWSTYENYLERPLREIRREFNIVVM